MRLDLLVAEPWDDYGLIDSGHGRKLERYGAWRFIRPEAQALWPPAASDWQAHGEFVGGSDEDGGGRWTLNRDVPSSWPLAWRDVRFWASNTPFRHLAFFPDMAPQWAWMADRLKPDAELLNLFGYTGVASLVAAKAGAKVTHVDASKKAISAAAENQKLAGLAQAPVRWLVDDALKFLRREVRRGRRYDAIILDPPKYGRGPEGEVWKLEEGLGEMLSLCRQLLDPRSSFLILTVYAIRMSAVALGSLLEQALSGLGGAVETGDMAIREEARGLLLPTAIYARWSSQT